nr:reverse transcriptase domain-containing protein [Tanacetum cinerariifolium]
GNTEDVQPQAVSSKPSVSTSEPANTPVGDSKPNLQASSIPYPSRRNDERNQEKAKDQIEKFYQLFKDMSFEISFTDALILMPKFASTLKALISNKEKLSEMARTPLNLCGMAECLALADLGASINLIPYSVWKNLSLPDLTPTCMTLELADRSISRPEVLGFSDVTASGNPTLIVSTTSPTITPFGDSDFLIFEEANAFLGLEDDPNSPELDPSYYDP